MSVWTARLLSDPPLPGMVPAVLPAIQITTAFSAGLAATSTQPESVRALLALFASPATAEIKRRNGTEAA